MCCELWATLCLADELCVLTFLPGRDLTLHVSVWRAECAMLTCCGPGLLKQVRPRWVVLEVNRGASLGHIIFFADKNVRARFPRPHAHERICECTCMPALATSSATTCARMYSCVCLCLCLSFLSVFSVSVSFSLSVSVGLCLSLFLSLCFLCSVRCHRSSYFCLPLTCSLFLWPTPRPSVCELASVRLTLCVSIVTGNSIQDARGAEHRQRSGHHQDG